MAPRRKIRKPISRKSPELGDLNSRYPSLVAINEKMCSKDSKFLRTSQQIKKNTAELIKEFFADRIDPAMLYSGSAILTIFDGLPGYDTTRAFADSKDGFSVIFVNWNFVKQKQTGSRPALIGLLAHELCHVEFQAKDCGLHCRNSAWRNRAGGLQIRLKKKYGSNCIVLTPLSHYHANDRKICAIHDRLGVE